MKTQDAIYKLKAAQRLRALSISPPRKYSYEYIVAHYNLCEFFENFYTIKTDLYGIELEISRHPEIIQIFIKDINRSTNTYKQLVGIVEFTTKTVSDQMPKLIKEILPYTYLPHSSINKRYRRRGIISKIYGNFLNDGYCLISHHQHTQDAHYLWQYLANSFQAILLNTDTLEVIQKDFPLELKATKNERLMLLGNGINVDKILELFTQRYPL